MHISLRTLAYQRSVTGQYFFAGRVITRLGTMPSMLAGLASTLVENIFCGLANRSWHHYAARPIGFLRPSAVAALNACLTLEGTSLGLAQGNHHR